jgi:hypothetical protein
VLTGLQKLQKSNVQGKIHSGNGDGGVDATFPHVLCLRERQAIQHFNWRGGIATERRHHETTCHNVAHPYRLRTGKTQYAAF